ncbi:MAG: hypothetical protein IJW46_05805 [Clostridia bacterium]|nr:hypothetical protein [Clostridia bacterium]
MHAVIFLLLTLIDITSLILIVRRLRDIRKNPHKYDETELVNRADDYASNRDYCRFFKSLSHQYSGVGLLLSFLLTALSGVLLWVLDRLIAGSGTSITPGARGAGIVAMLFLNLIVGIAIIPLHIKTPFFTVMVDGAFDGNRRDIWKKSYIAFLILFAITFPFFTLSANHYTHYNESGITHSAFFQIDETFTAYEEIEDVWISVGHNKHGQFSALRYEVLLSDGRRLDLSSTYYNENTLAIHRYIEATSNCRMHIEPLSEDDLAELQERLSPERLAIVLYIFEGIHETAEPSSFHAVEDGISRLQSKHITGLRLKKPFVDKCVEKLSHCDKVSVQNRFQENP